MSLKLLAISSRVALRRSNRSIKCSQVDTNWSALISRRLCHTSWKTSPWCRIFTQQSVKRPSISVLRFKSNQPQPSTITAGSLENNNSLPPVSLAKPSVKAKVVMPESKMDAKALSHYLLPLDQPVVNLDCTEAFNGLTDQEKLYTYYLSQASWVGGLIVTIQTSPESPAIFAILHDLFHSNGIDGLKSIAVGECDFTEDEFKALLVYTSGLFFNMGNYKGFGDTKFIPGLPVDKLESLITKAKFSGPNSAVIEKWNEIKDKLYSLSDKEKQLGLGEKGVTTYFSSNCTLDDAEIINRFMKKQNLEGYITRCFKTVEGKQVNYEIRSASVVTDTESPESHSFEDCNIRLTRGDYGPLLKKVCDNLLKAKDHASNETEQNMLQEYVKSFTEGSLDAHKDGSRYWIKDKGPIVETYIGFIETYRDPAGTRGEFEGFVSVVNRPMSAKFNTLVEKATDLITLLPWPKEFEKDTFLKPDFTSLDVVTFSGSGIPAGINIPNYDEIRQSEGFKNVSLGNVIPANYKDSNIPFLSDEDKDLMNKYRIPSFEVQVGLHELLGHGSGKLLIRNSDGTTNYPSDLKNPLTNDLIESSYEFGETYDGIFTTLGSAYEECRAECVGLLLSLDKTVLKIFGFEGDEADNVVYVNWLSMIFAGAGKALELYQPKTHTWMQAHSQARFVILQVLIEAGQGLVVIQEKLGSDGKPDLEIKLDRTKLDTVGRQAIADFLVKLQVYKATADIKSARAMFDRYSDVNDEGAHPWAKWRDIVLDKKQPRKLFVQSNLVNDGGNVKLKSYDSSPEGLIQSWVERFSDLSIYEELEKCRSMDKSFFK